MLVRLLLQRAGSDVGVVLREKLLRETATASPRFSAVFWTPLVCTAHHRYHDLTSRWLVQMPSPTSL